jgi:hypothetical protein
LIIGGVSKPSEHAKHAALSGKSSTTPASEKHYHRHYD